MLTALRASQPTLADDLELIAALPKEERLAAFDGTLLKMLWAYIVAHPDQIWAVATWVAKLLGWELPPFPIPVPPTPVNDGPSIG